MSGETTRGKKQTSGFALVVCVAVNLLMTAAGLTFIITGITGQQKVFGLLLLLCGQFPLLILKFETVLRWLRKKVVKRRAKKANRGDVNAVNDLIETLTNHPDSEIRTTADDALSQLENPIAINAFCSHWAKNRSPALEKVLVKASHIATRPLELHVLTALKVGKVEEITGMGSEVVELLIKTCEDKDKNIATQADKALCQLKNPEAIDAFCSRWVKARSPELEKVLVKAVYIAKRPPDIRVLSALKVGKVEVIVEMGLEVVEPLIKASRDSDKTIATQARGTLYQLNNSEVIEAFYEYLWARWRLYEIFGFWENPRPIRTRVCEAYNVLREKYSSKSERVVEILKKVYTVINSPPKRDLYHKELDIMQAVKEKVEAARFERKEAELWKSLCNLIREKYKSDVARVDKQAQESLVNELRWKV